ncbi:hypothetical protein ABVT39_017048 [Epinephelus coioides]
MLKPCGESGVFLEFYRHPHAPARSSECPNRSVPLLTKSTHNDTVNAAQCNSDTSHFFHSSVRINYSTEDFGLVTFAPGQWTHTPIRPNAAFE